MTDDMTQIFYTDPSAIGVVDRRDNVIYYSYGVCIMSNTELEGIKNRWGICAIMAHDDKLMVLTYGRLKTYE